MKEKDIRDHINAFLRSKLQNLVVPASMGLGLMAWGCDDSSLGSNPDGAVDSATLATGGYGAGGVYGFPASGGVPAGGSGGRPVLGGAGGSGGRTVHGGRVALEEGTDTGGSFGRGGIDGMSSVRRCPRGWLRRKDGPRWRGWLRRKVKHRGKYWKRRDLRVSGVRGPQWRGWLRRNGRGGRNRLWNGAVPGRRGGGCSRRKGSRGRRRGGQPIGRRLVRRQEGSVTDGIQRGCGADR